MRALLWARWKGFRKHKMLFLIMLFLPIVFTYFFSMSNSQEVTQIPIYMEDESQIANRLVEKINKQSDVDAILMDEKEMNEAIVDGIVDAGVVIDQSTVERLNTPNKSVTFTILRTTDTAGVQLIEQAVRSAASELSTEMNVTNSILKAIPNDIPINLTDVSPLVQQSFSEKPPISVTAEAYQSDSEVKYDASFQSLVGFTLFFTMYTIIFTLGELIEDRQNRVLDRMLISPVSIPNIYVANFIYSFILGYIQIIILFLFGKYVLGIEWGSALGSILIILALYVMTTMAVGMLLVGMSNTMQQLSALTPIVAVSFAMLGGAYWPIEIVESQLLVNLAHITPIFHAMNALKAFVLYDQTLQDVLSSILWLSSMSMGLFIIGILLFRVRMYR
ncbi:multidrug ABC transporter permease [Pontibacillus yanchengensis Y32]|uniref:Multidrug ABC transporter permease n=2 Tax=Pontibacillus yanchengensis TaxID=462910 RepID=A0A0A2TCD3_9BACI|nr:ABC transporter permease [Pontibacillus yanchengensis]KGP73477.1 multidrug ABC transporter permease [Pontibacillus yanchengensis Y32]